MKDEFENGYDENDFQEEKKAGEESEEAEEAEKEAAEPDDAEDGTESVCVEEKTEPRGYDDFYSRPQYREYGTEYNRRTEYYDGDRSSRSDRGAKKRDRNRSDDGHKRGATVFIVCVCLTVAFALGFGTSSIMRRASPIRSSSVSDDSRKINDSPKMNINESPAAPTAVSKDGPLAPSQIAEKIKPSIVGIMVYRKNSNSSAGEGTGVIMGEDKSGVYTYVITCAHVINGAGISVRVQTEAGATYDAEIVGFDTRTDLGVLKIKTTKLRAAEFGDSDALKVGDSVYALGNPGGVEFFGSFTGGFVSAIDRPVSSDIGYTMKCIQHDAAINPGNSGGALVNVYGQVVGINSQKIAATDYEGMGFAIPITSAKEIIENLIAYGYVPNRPKLGITYYPVGMSAQYNMIAQIKGLPAGTLIINEISADSSLAGTKARRFDMIIAIDGKPLKTPDVLLERIDDGKVGDKMKLTLCRVNSNYSTEEFDIEITLVEDRGSAEPETTAAQYVDPFENFYRQFGF